jgi:hypothetical protein
MRAMNAVRSLAGAERISTRGDRLVVQLSGRNFFDRVIVLAKNLIEGGTEVASVTLATRVSNDGERRADDKQPLIEIVFVR